MIKCDLYLFFILPLYIFQIILTTASFDINHTFKTVDNNKLHTCLSLSLPSSVRTIYPCSTITNQYSAQYRCDHFNVSELLAIHGGRISHSPAVIVYAMNSNDVQSVVKCAKKLDYIVNARGGGHSYEGYGLGSTYNNIVINMEAINYIHINQHDGTGTFGAGAKLGPIYYTAYQYNYTINGGSCAWVGLAGQVLGGGIGYLSRLYGLLSDNVLEMKAVNAQGDLLEINASREPDLFWALRGGGGGLFVIVTEFTIRLVRPPSCVKVFSSSWFLNATKSVIQRYQSLLFHDTISISNHNIRLSIVVTNHNITVSIDHFGSESKDFNQTILSLLANLPPPNKILLYEQDWLTYVYEQSGVNDGNHDQRRLLLINLTYPTFHFKAKHLLYSQPLSSHSLDQLIDQLALRNDRIFLSFSPWDGYMNTVPVDQTAFPHRSFKFGIQLMIYWDDGDDPKLQLDQLNEIYLTIYHDSTKYAYINYIDRDVPNWMDAYYHIHQQKLINIQRIYDKNNRFYFEKTIEIRSNRVDQHIVLHFGLLCFVIFLFFGAMSIHRIFNASYFCRRTFLILISCNCGSFD